MRLVDADVVREKIDEWLDDVGTAYVGKGLSYYGELLGCIDDTPTVEAEVVVRMTMSEWIPVEKESPPKPRFKWKGYLVQDAKVVEPYCGYWDGESWVDVEGEHICVIAWMELPKPYRKE